MPESIGSKKKVLPKGVVCDSCNNYFAVKVENPVLSDISMRNIRAFYQVPNKKNKLPSLLGELAGTGIKISLKRSKDGKLDVQPERESDREKLNEYFFKKLADGSFNPLLFTIDINPPKKEMSRFLAKMALEALAYLFLDNPSMIDMLIDNPHYDKIRDFARYGKAEKEWPYSQRRIYPTETNMRHPETDEWVQAGFGYDFLITPVPETYFVFIFYGMEFVINVGGPSITGYEQWLFTNKYISPVVERLGIKLVETSNNGRIEYFLEGDFNMLNGTLFDQALFY